MPDTTKDPVQYLSVLGDNGLGGLSRDRDEKVRWNA